MNDHDEHVQMVTDCVNRESKLTEWERQFVQSLWETLGHGRRLTEKQSETLNALWDRVT